MPRVEIVQTTPAHIRELAMTLRPHDRREAEAYGFPTNKILWRSYKNSIMRNTAFIDDQVAAVWGVNGTPLGDVGEPFLATSEIVDRISPLRFCRIYQEEVLRMLGIFPKLVNYVDSQYTKAVRLLDIVGFKIDEPLPFGPHGTLFCRFSMERK